MEDFLKANRVVEASVSKLGRVSKNRELPLRKALLVSKTLHEAQSAAENVQNSLLLTDNCIYTRGSSKLLATMKSTVSFEEDTVVSNIELSTRSCQKVKNQPLSPMVYSNHSSSETKDKHEDVMEFISHSVISDLLADEDMECFTEKRKQSSSTWATSSVNTDTTSVSWPSLQLQLSDMGETSPPLSPIKRQHKVAFPSFEDESFPSVDNVEDSKRFKFSSFDCTQSLPGFCDHLSPKNLCSAPLITYMFGKGFGVPSNPSELDWPQSCSSGDSSIDPFSLSPSKLLPVLAYWTFFPNLSFSILFFFFSKSYLFTLSLNLSSIFLYQVFTCMIFDHIPFFPNFNYSSSAC